MDRILILISAECFRDIYPALKSAKEEARDPYRLSFGLCLRQEPDPEEEQLMQTLLPLQFLAPADDPWRGMPQLWQGENLVLVTHPAVQYLPNWDTRLCRSLHACPEKKTRTSVLTGIPPVASDPVDAFYPVAADAFAADGTLTFRKGTPLRYAAGPQISAFLNPFFCFGPASFFRSVADAAGPRFLAAVQAGWHLHTSDVPCVHASAELIPDPCVPAEAGQDALEAYDLQYAADLSIGKLNAMLHCGICSSDYSFPTRVPAAVRAQEHFRRMTAGKEKLSPLFVTLRTAETRNRDFFPEEETAAFARLCRIRELPLLCYSEPAFGAPLQRLMQNVLAFSERYAIKAERNILPEEKGLWYRLSKLNLLNISREKMLNHTHYIWIDFDYLAYPVFENQKMDWSAFCRDRAMLATVGGEPDISMIVIPEKLLGDIAAAFLAICRDMSTADSLPEEKDVWARLLREQPAWFAVQELPFPRGLLELGMPSRREEILSRP